mmetsp:Transcript_18753/g.36743  ORF Transcript_18753/g.36743 Transcript_18753/m.36743 type:complete len:207 (-) Transcript_18753:292-912(-)
MTLRFEKTYGKGVLVHITGGKALVSRVKEGHQLALSTKVGNLLPLLFCWVHTSRVMSAYMQDDNTTRRRLTKILHEAIKVQTTGSRVQVRVLGSLEASVAKDLKVVAPRRVGDVDLGTWEVRVKELCANPKSTSTRQGLNRRNAVFLDSLGIFAKAEFLCSLAEDAVTGNGKVLLIAGLVLDEHFLRLVDNVENHRLALAITVGAY